MRLKAPILKILNLHGIHYFNKSKLRKYKFDDIDDTRDFALTDDFGNVEVVLEQFEIKTADYCKPRCVSCNKKTIVNVIQNMPLAFGLIYIYVLVI